MHTDVQSENLKGRDHWEELDVDKEYNIKTNLKELRVRHEGVDQIQLAQDVNQWRLL